MTNTDWWNIEWQTKSSTKDLNSKETDWKEKKKVFLKS